MSQAGAWTGLQFQGCGDTQGFNSPSPAFFFTWSTACLGVRDTAFERPRLSNFELTSCAGLRCFRRVAWPAAQRRRSKPKRQTRGIQIPSPSRAPSLWSLAFARASDRRFENQSRAPFSNRKGETFARAWTHRAFPLRKERKDVARFGDEPFFVKSKRQTRPRRAVWGGLRARLGATRHSSF